MCQLKFLSIYVVLGCIDIYALRRVGLAMAFASNIVASHIRIDRWGVRASQGRATVMATRSFRPSAPIVISIGPSWNYLRFPPFSIGKCREDFVCGDYPFIDRVILVGQDDDPQPLLRDKCYIRPEAVG